MHFVAQLVLIEPSASGACAYVCVCLRYFLFLAALQRQLFHLISLILFLAAAQHSSRRQRLAHAKDQKWVNLRAVAVANGTLKGTVRVRYSSIVVVLVK